MYILKPNPKVAEEFIRAILELVEEQNAQDGVIELTQQELIDKTEGVIQNSPHASGITNYFTSKGLIKRLVKGTNGRPSKWDVSQLLSHYNIRSAETTEEKAKQIYNVLKEEIANQEKQQPSDHQEEQEESQEPVSEETNKETPVYKEELLKDIQMTLSSMMEYIKSLPAEMIAPIQQFSEKINSLDDSKYNQLKQEYDELKKDYESTQHQLVELQNVLRLKEEEIVKLSQLTVPEYNKHKIYRSRNYILDELERFLALAGWARKSKEDHLRMVVANHLDNIMKELGIHEPIS